MIDSWLNPRCIYGIDMQSGVEGDLAQYFVKAHHHFSDPEWDGEPIEPEPKAIRPVLVRSSGVDELDQAKLTPLLRLKYHDSIADAVADLGRPDEIGRVFTRFQEYLYQQLAR